MTAQSYAPVGRISNVSSSARGRSNSPATAVPEVLVSYDARSDTDELNSSPKAVGSGVPSSRDTLPRSMIHRHASCGRAQRLQSEPPANDRPKANWRMPSRRFKNWG